MPRQPEGSAEEFGGDLFDIADMNDDELRALVVDQLREYPEIDSDWVTVDVRDGHVTLSGRVGTDQEVQVAYVVVHDVIGVENISNELVVDELHRGQLPEAADDAITHDEEVVDQRGEGEQLQSDTAGHLHQDLERMTFGTHDMQEAIRDGSTYIPPDRPISEGYDSGEDH